MFKNFGSFGKMAALALVGAMAIPIIILSIIVAIIGAVLTAVWEKLTGYNQCTISYKIECRKPSNIYFDDPITNTEILNTAKIMVKVRQLGLEQENFSNQGKNYEIKPVVDDLAILEERKLKTDQDKAKKLLEKDYEKKIAEQEELGNEERVTELEEELNVEKEKLESFQENEKAIETQIIEFRNEKRREVQAFKDKLYEISLINPDVVDGGTIIDRDEHSFEFWPDVIVIPSIEDLVDEGTEIEYLTLDEKVDIQVEHKEKQILEEIREYEKTHRDTNTSYLIETEFNSFVIKQGIIPSGNKFNNVNGLGRGVNS